MIEVNYDEMVTSLQETFDSFVDEAKKGKEGRGSKSSALKARKLSTKLANDLKDFRALSIVNDREKPVNKRDDSEHEASY